MAERMEVQMEDFIRHLEVKIKESHPLDEVLGEVFDPLEAVKFKLAVKEIMGCQTERLAFGGRSLRNLLGIETNDLAKDLKFDFREMGQDVRLGGDLIDALSQYNTKADKVSKRDLDFFVKGISIQKVSEILRQHKLSFDIRKGSGDVELIELNTPRGGATIIESEKSWQTKLTWPAIGFQSGVSKDADGEPQIDVNVSSWKIYANPLDMPAIFSVKNPTDTARFAGIARALLWSLTLKDPHGNWLRLPNVNTQREILKSISCTVPLLKWLNKNPDKVSDYGHSLTDMAIALRMVELNVHDSYYPDFLSRELFFATRHKFYNDVSVAFQGGKGVLTNQEFDYGKEVSPWGNMLNQF